MGTLDWSVVVALVVVSIAAGLLLSRRSSKQGAEGYFTGNRNLPWWAIAISNTSTYQSGNGGFVMLLVAFGLTGNWLWWGAWIFWMPLVALVWAPMWRRMRIVTTAELITLRYGGSPARWARKAYAVMCCFGFSVLLIGYITGFFAKTIHPLVPMSETSILLLFGGTTVLYTMFGGLLGVVVTEIMHFVILLGGSFIFFFIAVGQHGGWGAILERIAQVRPEALQQTPPTSQIPVMMLVMLVLQGLCFAGSPTAGEGMTAQRFMAARSERHAIAGQLFNCLLALTVRTLPLIGMGLVAMSLFWTEGLVRQVGPAPAGMVLLEQPEYAWGELIKRCTLPPGFVGLLVATEVAAYTSALSSLINWGSSFVVNDLYAPMHPGRTPKHQVWVSRLTTLILFVAAATVAILYVKGMVGWFMFINSAMVMFLLPLALFRFFWWRFNVWGELSAIVLGLPLSILIWFVLDFQNEAKYPMWQGLGLLFVLSFVVLTGVTLATPPERPETLERFYRRCRPPGFWKPVLHRIGRLDREGPTTRRLVVDSVLGILCCLGLVLATNAVFVNSWLRFGLGMALAIGLGGWLVARMFDYERWSDAPGASTPAA
ncbi:MAG: hypothetical protein KA354_21910 [Phycisphaerae bacterium]|nr:hypothetical protein [Phycisphaerae bacterium]